MSTIVRWSALFTLLFLSPHTRFCHILRRVHSHIWTLCQICLPIFFSQHGLKLRFLLDHSQFLLYNLGKKKGKKRLSYIYMLFAGIDSKSVGGDTVWVRPPSPAFLIPKPFSGLGIFLCGRQTEQICDAGTGRLLTVSRKCAIIIMD